LLQSLEVESAGAEGEPRDERPARGVHGLLRAPPPELHGHL